jgi:hypothetical protein
MWEHLKTLLHSVAIENKDIIYQRIFDAYQTICKHAGNSERVRHSMIRCVMGALIQVKDILSICYELSFDKQ